MKMKIKLINNSNHKTLKIYLLLIFSVFMISFDTVIFKTASGYPMLSKEFILWYALALSLYFFYAIFWQIILKHIPLSVAYSIRCIVVVLGLIWSVIIFGEQITPWNVAGATFILVGVFLVTNKKSANESEAS